MTGAKMLNKNFVITTILILTMLVSGCTAKKKEPKPEEFLTLADLSGRVSLKEDSPGVRVIRIKSKAFIKRNDIRAAKAKAMEIASTQAVDAMVRELLPDEDYNNNFEQIEISKNLLDEKSKLLKENMEVDIQFYDDQAMSVQLPNTVELIIETTDAAIKGQTASSSYKPATLENGIKIMVPPFINSGDKISLDTRTLEYIKKVK